MRGMEKMSLEVEQRMQGRRENTFTFLDRQEVCLIHSSAGLKGTPLVESQEATAAHSKAASRLTRKLQSIAAAEKGRKTQNRNKEALHHRLLKQGQRPCPSP